MLDLEDVKNATLRDAIENLEQIDYAVVQNDGEYAAGWMELMSLLDGKIDNKFQSIAAIVINKKAEAEQYSKHISKLQAREKAVKKTVSSLEKYAEECMVKLKIKKTGTKPGFMLSPTAGKVVVNCEYDLPSRYVKHTAVTTVDKAGIKDAIKRGVPVSGAEIVPGTSLRVKV